MDSRICIDGFYKGNGHYETVIHGGEANPNALCSLIMRIDRNAEVEELLKMMQEYVKGCVDADNDKIIERLVQEGKL